ncbi:MAG: hypothetical protein JOZ51_19940 [Chloroflexi bacterium]|nr:hypothetical protein [Chloroflexota bacterium]
MYRSFMITPLLRHSIIGLGLVLLLPSCTLTNDTSPESVTSAIVQPSTPAPEAVAATTPVDAAEHKLAWESLIIKVPELASFQSLPSVAAPVTNGLPLIAAGTFMYPEGIDMYGPNLMIFEFEGTVEEWLDLERAGDIPHDIASKPFHMLEESVKPRTIAGKQGFAYQFDVPPQDGKIAESYAVKLDDKQLLVIVTGDIRNSTYQSVINTLKRQE